MPFCTKSTCPLNRVDVTPETSGVDLVVAFLAGTHQPDAQFTPQQIGEIYNEILFLVRKYNATLRAARNAAAEAGNSDHDDLGYFDDGDLTDTEEAGNIGIGENLGNNQEG